MDKHSVPPLETENLACRLDERDHTLYIVYRGTLTGFVAAQAYEWMMLNAKASVVATLRGGIFDFREVTRFELGNLSTVQRKSREFNTAAQLDHIPVALIIGDTQQEHFVRVAMRVSPQEHRKRIVKSLDEARAFFEWFHRDTAINE